MARLLQLIHAESVRDGGRFDWSKYFDPSPELLAPFDREGNNQPKWEDFDL